MQLIDAHGGLHFKVCSNLMASEYWQVISRADVQVHLMKSMRTESMLATEISSVDGFQGREKEAIIISMVCSGTHCLCPDGN